MNSLNLDLLSSSEKQELIKLLEEKEYRKSRRLIDTLYPEEGPYRLELYPKHLEFFDAGAIYRERAAICANRIGKTLGMGGYETALHLTGLYPDWWEGRKFTKPTKVWAAGKTNETTRDIVQATMLGGITFDGARKTVTGTGLILGDTIGQIAWKQGVQDLADTVKIKHVSGGWSVFGLKSYQQGRGSFEGTAQDVIWLDEECSMDIYGECLIRTATTNGLIYTTFTPLEGMTEMALSFMPGGKVPVDA